MSLNLTRKEVYEFYKEKPRVPFKDKVDHVISNIPSANPETIRRVCNEFKRRSCKTVALDNPAHPSYQWLGEKIEKAEKKDLTPVKKASSGRPPQAFHELSDRSKRRRVEGLRGSTSTSELLFAAEMNMREEGNLEAAKVIHAAGSNNMEADIKKALSLADIQVGVYEDDEALALYLQLDLGKEDYLQLRRGAVSRGLPKLYPSYKKITKAIDRCCPDRSEITVTESGAEITLQGLLDHTARRLVGMPTVQKNFSKTSTDDPIRLELTSKWGFDGTSGNSTYKQKTQEKMTDASLFLTCLVPLSLTSVDNQPTTNQVWMNTRPNSTRFCRPVSFFFTKETPEFVERHYQKMEAQIANLKPTVFSMEGRHGEVCHKLFVTMVDGKICSVLNNTSSCKCHVCEASPVQMNNIDEILLRPVNEESYKFGISPLHARIRCLEYILHVSYRLPEPLRRWRVEKNLQPILQDRKKTIQDRFRSEMGLLVDAVKQGHGSTNDGNTARRVFRDPKKSAQLLDMEEEVVERLGTILEVVSCGRKTDIDAFREYCHQTARLLVAKYPWYYMPQAVHKLLIHGADIIKAFPLPVGALSEEAEESNNRIAKHNREHHTRKMDRIDTNFDWLRRMLSESCVAVSSILHPCVESLMEPSPEMAKLLLLE